MNKFYPGQTIYRMSDTEGVIQDIIQAVIYEDRIFKYLFLPTYFKNIHNSEYKNIFKIKPESVIKINENLLFTTKEELIASL